MEYSRYYSAANLYSTHMYDYLCGCQEDERYDGSLRSGQPSYNVWLSGHPPPAYAQIVRQASKLTEESKR